LNAAIPERQPKLHAPDPKFNRQIGEFANKPYSVDGHLLSEPEHKEHLRKVLPQPQDLETIKAATTNSDWVVASQESAH
jgi:hypothetical protein